MLALGMPEAMTWPTELDRLILRHLDFYAGMSDGDALEYAESLNL
jgi:hypothetical protein